MREYLITHWQLFGYSYLSALLLAALGAYIGVYVVLRRIVFVGIGLIQIAAVGVALAYLTHMNPLLFSISTTLLGVLLFAAIKTNGKVSHESIIGAIYACAGALSLLLISKSALGTEELKHFLYGQILLVNAQQFWIMLLTFSLIALFYFLFSKEILFVSFDPQTARSCGISPHIWDFGFYFTLGIVIAISTKAAGVLMMFSFLVIPPLVALLLCQQMRTTFLVSIAFAIISTIVGLVLQHIWELPPGQTIVVVSSFVLICVALWRWHFGFVVLFAAICIAIGIFATIPSKTTHPYQAHKKQEVLVKIIPEKKIYSKGTSITLDIEIDNPFLQPRKFFLNLDFGTESIVWELEISAHSYIHKKFIIPFEKMRFLEGKISLLPTFWKDIDSIEPVDFPIKAKETTLVIH